jgi:hypothetical protein
MNSYSSSAKTEIAALSPSLDCCTLAFLSALVHTAGSVFFTSEGLKLVVPFDLPIIKDKLCAVCNKFYGFVPQTDGKRAVFCGDEAQTILFDCKIFGVVDGETTVVSGIADTLITYDHCKKHYLRGAFLGAGSVSLKAGYHLEFSLSNADFASDLAALIESLGVDAKTTIRNGKYVVYVKDNESVSDCLALMGASKAVLQLNDEYSQRDMRKYTNRISNCDMANLNKTVEASFRQCEDIRLIDRKLGLSSLNAKLSVVAQARLDNPEESFAFLASELNLPKSTIKNRLNKLSEIARSLREKGETNV